VLSTNLSSAVNALVVEAGTASAANTAPAVTVANPSLNVNVTNNPLPVAVTNATTNQSVTVTNSNTNPIPVTVQPAEEPFQIDSGLVSSATSLISGNLVTVPAGKLLVIEHVSANIDVTGSNGLSAAQLVIAKASPDSVACFATGTSTDLQNHFYSCSTQTKYYVSAGQTVSFRVGTVDTAGGGFIAFISGHYVPAP
jgi:hypothetical protein